MIEILSRAHAQEKKNLNEFKFGSFVGRLPSDDGASMAVERLNRANRDLRRRKIERGSGTYDS